MLKGGNGGTIVNMASIAGLRQGQGGFAWSGYHAAKYGTVALTRLFEVKIFL